MINIEVAQIAMVIWVNGVPILNIRDIIGAMDAIIKSYINYL